MKSHIGLALSGGGTRGIAHIGVIKAIQEFGLEPSFVSGTSAGAIIGAMYCAGMECQEMLKFFKSVNLFSFRNYSLGKPGLLNSDNYRKEFEKIIPAQTFADLNRPLFVSITNLISGRNEIWHEGPLAPALVASGAFPGIFTPVVVDDIMYADGGITNNFPLDPLCWKCGLVIGSYVNPLKKVQPTDLRNTLAVLDRVFHINMLRMASPDFHKAQIFIMPESLSKYKTFSLTHIDEIFEIGYKEAKVQLEKYFHNGPIAEAALP